MGQTAVELPEPIDAPVPSPSASADDVLSKLAGDEVDRILAEADSPTESPLVSAEPNAVESVAAFGNVSPALAKPSDVSPESAVQAQLDELFNELSGATPGEGSVSTPKDQVDQDQVDQLIAQASAEQTAEAPVVAALEPPPPPATEAETLDAQLVQSLADVAPSPAPSTKALSPHSASPAVGVSSSAGGPWYLKPLELLNAPFASIPLPTRELLGKVAIVTVFNAGVVLIYVLLVRGH